MDKACANCGVLAAQLQADKERRAKLNSQLLTLREESRAWGTERSELEHALSGKESEVQTLQAQLAEKAAEVTNLSTELSHATFARECAAGDVSELQAQVQELGAELQEQQGRVQQAEAQAADLSAEIVLLRSQSASDRTARLDAEAAASVAIEEGARLTESILQLQLQVQELQAAVELTTRECSTLQSQLAEHVTELAAVEHRAATAEAALAEASRQAGETAIAMQHEHRAAIDALQLQLELALAEKAEAERYHRTLEEQLSASQAAQHVAHDRVRQISHDALAAQLNRVPSPPPLQRQARAAPKESTPASSAPTLGSPVAVRDLPHDQQTHVMLETYKRDLDTAKAFGKALLQSNRQLQEEVRQLKLQLSRAVAPGCGLTSA